MAEQEPEGAERPGGTSGSPRSDNRAYRSLFGDRSYRLWFMSTVGSGLGDWTGLFALQVLVASLAETGSPMQLFALSGIMMARLLPSLFLGPISGVIADRYDRKRLMVFTNILRAVLFAAIAFQRDLVAVFALTFAVECLSLLFLSSKDASLPALVRKQHLPQANQMNLLATYGMLPVGAVVASAMIGVAASLRGLGVTGADPTVMALLLNALTFAVSAVLLSRIKLPSSGRRAHAPDAASPKVLEDLKEGLRFIKGLPLIRSLILGVVGVFFGGGVVISLGPVFVGTSLGGQETDWYLLMAAVGLGLVAGLSAVPLLLKWVRKERIFPIALACTSAVAVVMATLSSLPVTLGYGFALGAAVGVSFVVGYTLLQTYTPDDVRARTFATFYTVTRAAMFAALGLAPLLAGTVGVGSIVLADQTFRMSGVRLVLLAGGLVALFSAVSAGRGMFRALRDDPNRALRLPAPPMPNADGLFVVVEGVEGAGKSTQVTRLVETLRAEGHDVVVTREPGGTPIAERIRGVLLDPNSDSMESRTEALLYAAARAEHVTQVIRPALQRGAVVVCDRFIHSSLAYQGYGRNLGEQDVFEINRWAIAGLLPDVVVLLHLDPQDGMRRVAERARRSAGRRLVDASTTDWERGESPDRLEREDIAFHEQVANGFLDLAKHDRSRFCVVDASGDASSIARQIRLGLHNWLPVPRGYRDRVSGLDATSEFQADPPVHGDQEKGSAG